MKKRSKYYEVGVFAVYAFILGGCSSSDQNLNTETVNLGNAKLSQFSENNIERLTMLAEQGLALQEIGGNVNLVPENSISKDCFSQTAIPRPYQNVPPEYKNSQVLTKQVIAIYINDNGKIIRKEPLKGSDLEKDVIAHLMNSKYETVYNLLKKNMSDLQNSTRDLSTIPTDLTDKLRSPLSVMTNDRAHITFVLLNENWFFIPNSFSVRNLPALTYRSPFHSWNIEPVQKEGEDKMYTIKYERDERFSRTKCKYKYDLHIQVKHQAGSYGGGYLATTPVIIDPIIQNDGAGPP